MIEIGNPTKIKFEGTLVKRDGVRWIDIRRVGREKVETSLKFSEVFPETFNIMEDMIDKLNEVSYEQ